jgi:hypothetical protein
MFNNYAIVQGVDHIVPVDIYLPGCPPRPEMLLDAIVKLHDKIQNMKLGANREAEVEELEQARLRRLPLTQGAAGHPGIGGSHPAGIGAPAPALLGHATAERDRAAAEPHGQVAGIGLSGTGSGMHGTDSGPPHAAHSELDEPEPGERS